MARAGIRCVAVKPNLAIQSLRGWLLLVHGPAAPTAEEWQRYLDMLQQSPLTMRGQLIHSLGGAPDSAQRARSIEIGKPLFEERKKRGIPALRTAVMSQSAAVRALATVSNWLFDDTFLGFRLDDWEGTFAHLGVAPTDREALKEAVNTLKKHVESGPEGAPAKPR